MSRKNKILIVAVIILLVLALAYWLFLRPKYTAPGESTKPAANANTNVTTPVALPAVNIAEPSSEIKIPDEDKLKSDLSRIAAAFAERLGSYSNQGNFENINDLKVLMTEKMKQWADNLIEKTRTAAVNSSVYSGVTTKAVSTSISSLDESDGSAKIIVGTQRRETAGSMAGNEKISYQDLELNFEKVGDSWMVDEANWGPVH